MRKITYAIILVLLIPIATALKVISPYPIVTTSGSYGGGTTTITTSCPYGYLMQNISNNVAQCIAVDINLTTNWNESGYIINWNASGWIKDQKPEIITYVNNIIQNNCSGSTPLIESFQLMSCAQDVCVTNLSNAVMLLSNDFSLYSEG